MAANGIGSEDIWMTEGSWNGSGSTTMNPEQRAAWLAQQYIFLWSKGVARYYWFTWDSQRYGTLWDPANGVHPAGTAYGLLYNWLVGSVHPDQPCSQSADATWTCTLTLANGKPAEIIWNENGSISLAVRAAFTTYQTLDNSTANSIVGNTVTIGNKPILVVGN